jgi:hypothetical protein
VDSLNPSIGTIKYALIIIDRRMSELSVFNLGFLFGEAES